MPNPSPVPTYHIPPQWSIYARPRAPLLGVIRCHKGDQYTEHHLMAEIHPYGPPMDEGAWTSHTVRVELRCIDGTLAHEPRQILVPAPGTTLRVGPPITLLDESGLGVGMAISAVLLYALWQRKLRRRG